MLPWSPFESTYGVRLIMQTCWRRANLRHVTFLSSLQSLKRLLLFCFAQGFNLRSLGLEDFFAHDGSSVLPPLDIIQDRSRLDETDA